MSMYSSLSQSAINYIVFFISKYKSDYLLPVHGAYEFIESHFLFTFLSFNLFQLHDLLIHSFILC